MFGFKKVAMPTAARRCPAAITKSARLKSISSIITR